MRYRYLLLLLFGYVLLPCFANAGEIDQYKKIKSLELISDSTVLTESLRFIKTFPKSSYIDDIRLVAARNESSVDKALLQCSLVRNKGVENPFYNQASVLQCELLFISGRFEECAKSARILASKNNDTSTKRAASVYLIRSLLLLQDYKEADVSFNRFSKFMTENDLNSIANEISQKIGEHDYNLGSDPIHSPSILLFLSRYYKITRKYNESFSALKDLQELFPRSPEALTSLYDFEELKKSGSKYTENYLSLIQPNNVDILSPEDPVADETSDNHYAVSIGPFDSVSNVRKIKKEMTSDYGSIMLVGTGGKYYLYIGDESTPDGATEIRIRLAEEYGINGRIVQITSENNHEYIYGQ